MPDEAPPSVIPKPNVQVETSRDAFKLGNLIAVFAVCLLAATVVLSVTKLQPTSTPLGRPIGAAGDVEALAVPADRVGETFIVRTNGRQTFALPTKADRSFERIELSSNDVDVAGDAAPDLVLYGWTGGAHCCFTQFVVDGQSGKLIGQFELGNSDPTPFIPAQAKDLARAVALGVDDVSVSRFGSYAESPMASIVVAWDGRRFGLDLKRMKAAAATSPPAFFINEPDLAEAVPLGVQDFGEDEASPGNMIASTLASPTASRGDLAQAYETWMDSERVRMVATKLDPQDPTSFGPMAAFLNERVYKGQAQAGVDEIMTAYEASPEARDAALAYYFDVLRQSRWFDDLNKLNSGALTKMPSAAVSTNVGSPKR